jgi:hypothetical protein
VFLGGVLMNRSTYFNYIEEKLQILAYRISQRGKINILDLNIYSETFFADLLNILFNLELVNLNVFKQNVEGIDLVDHRNKTIAQVSATCTKQKVENSLSKKIFKEFAGYRFKFISIAKDATKLKSESFANPHGALFSPSDDIIDVGTILNIVLNMSIDNQKALYEFVKKELGADTDIVKMDSNLATVINILAAENLNEGVDSPEINTFEIIRKIEFNDLVSVKDTIDDYKIYYQKLDEKYSEFDREGSNRSLSVFQMIKKQYLLLQSENQCSHDIFYSIIDNIIGIVVKSKNYVEIPYEELEMCVHILVVDAFIRCKIFKNPEDYDYVVTR